MQQYAEEAVQEHMSNLQEYFLQSKRRNKTAPFYDIETEQVDMILRRAMKNSDRWREMKRMELQKKTLKLLLSAKENENFSHGKEI